MTSPVICPSCGVLDATGNFCSACGAPLGPRVCRSCSASLSPAARFCHRCGEPAAGVIRRKSEQTAWIIAGTTCVALIAGIIWFVVRDKPVPVTPDMANVGSAGANLPSGRAPDISQLTPQQRFDRLFDRVTRAADSGDTTQVTQFTPMALGAYAQLDTITIDDRFHAAVLRLNVGDLPGALALADTIQQAVPGHLFAPIIRANVASAGSDRAALLRSYRAFLASYSVEIARNRPEYQDHRPIVDEFRKQADSAVAAHP
jgi:ribosomal protein L40E